jgi:hypothetical protein
MSKSFLFENLNNRVFSEMSSYNAGVDEAFHLIPWATATFPKAMAICPNTSQIKL